MQERQLPAKLIDPAETSGFGHRWLMRPGLGGGVRVVFPAPALAQGVCRLVLVPCGGSLAHRTCSVSPVWFCLQHFFKGEQLNGPYMLSAG